MDPSGTTMMASGSIPEQVEWRLQGQHKERIYFCNRKLLADFQEKYEVKRYIHAGWYSRVYEVESRQDRSRWAMKVVEHNPLRSFARLDWDLNNLDKTKGEQSVIQKRAHFDFGRTAVVVLQLADGDLHNPRQRLLARIKDDDSFRVLARQLLESVDALDRHGICHSPGVLDFLYFKAEGRVKISALERGEPVTDDNPGNLLALKAVSEALESAAKHIQDLSPESMALLEQLNSALPSDEYRKQLSDANNIDLIFEQLELDDKLPLDEGYAKAKAVREEKVASLKAQERARRKPCARELLSHKAVVDIPTDARLNL